MEHFRGKVVGIMRVSGSPSALDCLQFLEARCEDFPQLFEILQRPA
jgi:hypothetical protein